MCNLGWVWGQDERPSTGAQKRSWVASKRFCVFDETDHREGREAGPERLGLRIVRECNEVIDIGELEGDRARG